MNKVEPKEYWDKRFQDFGKYSTGYTDKLLHKYDDNIRWNCFSKEVKILKGDKVLDIGCNYGEWSFRLAKLGANVIGIDIISKAIQLAKKKSEGQSLNISFKEMSVHELNFGNNFFDKIISITVMQHILDDKLFKMSLNKMNKQLKSNGELIFIESASKNKIQETQKHKRERTLDNQIKLLFDAGFYLSKIRGVNHLSSKSYYLLEIIPIPKFIKLRLQNIILIFLNPIDIFLSRFSFFSKFSRLKLMIFKKI